MQVATHCLQYSWSLYLITSLELLVILGEESEDELVLEFKSIPLLFRLPKQYVLLNNVSLQAQYPVYPRWQRRKPRHLPSHFLQTEEREHEDSDLTLVTICFLLSAKQPFLKALSFFNATAEWQKSTWGTNLRSRELLLQLRSQVEGSFGQTVSSKPFHRRIMCYCLMFSRTPFLE